MSRAGTSALLRRHLSARPLGGIVVAVLTALLAALAAAVPIAVGALGDASLRDRLDTLAPTERDVATTVAGLPQLDSSAFAGGPADEQTVWGPFLDGLEGVRADAASPLDELLGPAAVVSRSLENPLRGDERTRALTVAFSPGFADRIEIVEGALPEPAAIVLGPAGPEAEHAVEIVLSVDSAAALDWAVGEERDIASAARRGAYTAYVLSGTFRPRDGGDAFWQHVPSVLDPSVVDDGNAPRVTTGTAFADSASLALAYDLGGRQETRIWYPFDAAAVTADDAEATLAALRRLTADSRPVGSGSGYGISSVRFEADVADTLELALGQARATAAALAITASGPAAVAAAVLVLGCRLILVRRGSAVRLLSARGASAGQTRGLLAVEGVLVGLVPAAVATAVVVAVARAAPVPALLVAPLVIGLAPTGILVALAAAAARRSARADLGRRGSRLRVLAEGLVAGAAAAALVLVLLRGRGQGADPLLVAAPLLLALTAGVVTVRLYPLPLRAIVERLRRRPGLGGFLGAARALREPALGLAPVLALVVGVAVAVASGILLATLQAGVRDSAEGQTGADVRIVGGSFDAARLAAAADVPGVAGVAGISGAEPVQVDLGDRQRPSSVFVVDAAELERVQGEGLGLLPPGASLAGDGDRMPIVVSPEMERLIDGAPVTVEGVEAEVVGVATGQTPVSSRSRWIAIDSAYAARVLDRDPVDRTVLVKLDAGSTAAEVEAGLRAALGDGIRLQTPGSVIALIEQGPAAQGLRAALIAATVLAAALSVLAIVLTLALAAAPRRRAGALLRSLGAPRRAQSSLVAWEIAPPAAAAVVAGLVFGGLLPLVVLAAVDLRAFTGSLVQPVYRADPGAVALVVGGFILTAAALTAVAALSARNLRAGTVLRSIEEG